MFISLDKKYPQTFRMCELQLYGNNYTSRKGYLSSKEGTNAIWKTTDGLSELKDSEIKGWKYIDEPFKF
jgi:hypothetical protein